MSELYASLRALGDALAVASMGDDLAAALRERRDVVEAPAVRYTIRCLIGLNCELTGETPRSLLDAEFENAPSDEFWRAAAIGRRA